MCKTIEEILAPKPEARPRIYAYAIDDNAHAGLLKVGQSSRDVKQRVAEQPRTAAIRNYRIELDETAPRADGTIFSDHNVRAALSEKRNACRHGTGIAFLRRLVRGPASYCATLHKQFCCAEARRRQA